MKQVLIERFLGSNEGVFGQMTLGDLILFSGEEQWAQNQRKVSCIPAGNYTLVKHHIDHMNLDTYMFVGVSNRDGICVHYGNTEEDTEGCVLVGMALGVVAVLKDENTGKPSKKLAVLQSRTAHKKFMEAMGGADDVPVTVRWVSAVNPEV